MSERYDHQRIEAKWQKKWKEAGIYRAEFPSRKKKYYVLIEFPYPSGERLHVGHARSYSAMDAVARKRRMEGYNVLYPIGWDAFGLPAENFAVKTGIHPSITTKENIANAKKQAKSWGLSFDWSREINTTDPDYYKWTQWIFVQLFKQGLAYRAEIPVNWCPSCKINLANEEVIKKLKIKNEKLKIRKEVNVCERCGTEVGKRMQKQWMLRITEYAERLLEDLEKVDYREDIARQQQEWIGKSDGCAITFKVQVPRQARDPDQSIGSSRFKIETFTTRLDTLYGATALVVAPDKMTEVEGENKHLTLEIASKEQYQKVTKYIKESQKISELERTELKEKTGEFTGAYAINPINGEKIPVWVADYVIGWYGEGAIMLVPAHDERDWEFAKRYGIKIRRVIRGNQGNGGDQPRTTQGQYHVGYTPLGAGFGERGNRGERGEQGVVFETECSNGVIGSLASYKIIAFTADGVLIDSGKYSGLTSEEAREKMLEDGQKAGWARPKTTFKLRDWVFSRQHYWGEPIPMIFCQSCAEEERSWFTISQNDRDYRSSSNGKTGDKVQTENSRDGNVINLSKKNLNVPCKSWDSAGWFPVAEEELPVGLPYVERYQPTDSGESPLANVSNWVKVRCPSCGGEARRETDTMPNWAGSSWYFLAYPFGDKLGENENTKTQKHKNRGEIVFSKYNKQLKYWLPVDWYNGGLEHTTLHLLYSRFWHKFLFDLGVVPTDEPYAKRTSHGVVLGPDGAKMSKSKGNVISPDEVVEEYGADSFRVYEMFMGPFEEMVAWDGRALSGVRRFLERVWRMYQELPVTKFSSRQNSPPDVRRGRSDSNLSSLPTNKDTATGNIAADSGGSNDGSWPQAESSLAQTVVSSENLSHGSSSEGGDSSLQSALKRKLHQTVKKVSEDIEELKFNTAIAALMEFVNFVYKFPFKAQGLRLRGRSDSGSSRLEAEDKEVFLRLLAPFAPHLAEELYQKVKSMPRTVRRCVGLVRGQKSPCLPAGRKVKSNRFESVHLQPWPEYDPQLVEEEAVEFVVQVNGRVREKLKVKSQTLNQSKLGSGHESKVKSQIEKKARESKKVLKYLQGKKIKRTIFVPGKLINFVT